MEFTRTTEEIVSNEFWIKNLEVMKNTITLFENVANSLRLFKENIKAN